jgi:hypothetical protein
MAAEIPSDPSDATRATKKRPVRVPMSGLTGRAWAITDDTEDGGDEIAVKVKHDVTDDVVRHLMAVAWA